MKTYSNDSVTPEQVEAAATRAAQSAADAVDAKQSRQIKQLRLWCFVLSVLTVGQAVVLTALFTL